MRRRQHKRAGRAGEISTTPTKSPGAVTPRLKKKANMNTNTKNAGQVKRLVLDNTEVTK